MSNADDEAPPRAMARADGSRANVRLPSRPWCLCPRRQVPRGAGRGTSVYSAMGSSIRVFRHIVGPVQGAVFPCRNMSKNLPRIAQHHVMSEIEQTRSVRIPKMSWGRCSGEEAVSVTEYLERARECVGPCRPHEWRGQEEVARNCRGLDQDGNCRGSRGGGQAHRSVARQQGAIGRPLRWPHTSIVTIPCR